MSKKITLKLRIPKMDKDILEQYNALTYFLYSENKQYSRMRWINALIERNQGKKMKVTFELIKEAK